MMLVARGTSATPDQLRALQAQVPGLARMDQGELELALAVLPICILADVGEAYGRKLLAALAEEGLTLELVEDHALHRLLIAPPPADDVLLELDLSPTFHPPTWLRASASRGLEVWHFEAWAPSLRLHARVDLDELERALTLRFVHARAELDTATLAGLREACLRVCEPGDEFVDPSLMRDGIGVSLVLTDPPLHLDVPSPEPHEAPRLCALLERVLGLAVPLLPEVAHLPRYFERVTPPRKRRR
jgi:hypothetical protein